jgi:hypothetical protein
LSGSKEILVADVQQDVVSNITVTKSDSTPSTFSQIVEVKWLPPKNPNGAVVSYQLHLAYNLTAEEATLISEDAVLSVFPSYNNKNCQYKLAMDEKFIRCNDIINTTITLLLFRVSRRELLYHLTVVVKSEAGFSDRNLTKNFTVSAATPDTENDGVDVTMIALLSAISGMLVLVTVGLGLYVTRLKVRKRRLRFENYWL